MADTITTIADLHLDQRNARKRGPRASGMLEASLQEVGVARSIVIDEAGNILAGNGTVEAAEQVGIERVQVVDADGETIVAVRRTGLTKAQKRRLALLDNRTAELAEWEPEVLAELATDGVKLDDLFVGDELDAILAGMEQAPEPGAGGDEFDATPEEGPTVCQPKDLWQLGPHRLMCGDSTKREDVERLMGGERAGCVLTDPPYGINREGITNDDPEGLRALFDGVLACLPADNAVVVAFQSPRLFPVWLDAIREAGYEFERMLWLYKNNDCTHPWRGWLLTSEAILLSSVGEPIWDARFTEPYAHDCYTVSWDATTMVDVPGWHGSIKPFTVIKDLLSRLAGDVYDPFLGSGTTLIAAHRLGRKCYGIEIEPRYCDVILRRYEAETGEQGVRVT